MCSFFMGLGSRSERVIRFFPVNPMELLSVDMYFSFSTRSAEGSFKWMSLQHATNKKYLEKVVILLWKKRISKRGYSYKSEVFIKSEKEMLKEEDDEVKFVENPLHIRKPTDEQYDYFNQLFN